MRLLEQDVDVEETDVEVDVEVEEIPPAPGEQAIAELIAAAFAYLSAEEAIENANLSNEVLKDLT